MPRKKKRSTLQRKPSLVFIESPVHVQKNVPSPVFCARHPPLADTVQVEELHHLSWVSPQFRGGATSTGPGHRAKRRRRKSIACLRNINKENTCNGQNDFRRNINYKFRTLKFLGDPTINVSDAEDIEFTIDSATEDEQVIHDEETGATNEGKVTNDKETANFLQKRRKLKENEDNSCRTAKNLKNIPENHAKLDNDGSSSSDKSDNETLNQSSKIDFTQVRKRPVSAPPVKRLFSTQLGSASNFDIDGAICTNDVTQAINLESESEGVSETEPETISESESGMETPPIRRSLRIQALMKVLLQATPATQKTGVILAPDTPEEECGLTLRQRQLRNYVKK